MQLPIRVLNAQDAYDVYEANALDLGAAYLDNATDANKVFLDNATDADEIASTTAQNLANAREQDAVSRYALYEQNLANRKDGAQIGTALNNTARNATAGMNTVYAGQDTTNASLNRAGMQLGQGELPRQSSHPTAPVKKAFREVLCKESRAGLVPILWLMHYFQMGWVEVLELHPQE